MANKRIIELNERTVINMGDYLMVDDATGSRKLAMSTLFNYLTYSSLMFVDTLPTTDIDPTVIYLVPHSGSTTQWDEYIYRDNQWVLIGTSTLDLSAIYQTKAAATVQDNNIPWYGTSSTAAATTAKVATTAAGNLGALAAGQKVSIKFTNANTASAPTLNVDGKGAHAIKAYGTTAPIVWWNAGDVVTFTYDGTNWIMGATSGQIEQINSNASKYVSVTSTGSETRSQLFDRLHALIDFTKITKNPLIEFNGIKRFCEIEGTTIKGTLANCSTTVAAINTITCIASSSTIYDVQINSSNVTFTNESSTVLPAGIVVKFIY